MRVGLRGPAYAAQPVRPGLYRVPSAKTAEGCDKPWNHPELPVVRMALRVSHKLAVWVVEQLGVRLARFEWAALGSAGSESG